MSSSGEMTRSRPPYLSITGAGGLRHQAVPPGWGYLSGEAAPVGSVNSDDGHQFQRPRSNAMEGTRSVRTKNVSKRMAKAIVNPSCRDWSELPAIARTVKVPARMRPADVIVLPVLHTASMRGSRGF